MTRTRSITLGVGAVLALWTAASVNGSAPPGTNPATAEAIALLDDVYDLSVWSTRAPLEWAAPRLGRLGLQGWVATLPLEADVRARLDARLQAEGFVDELVPFALFVKDMYAAPAEPDFATWARGALVPVPGQPGWETSLFTFTPPSAEAGGGLGLSAEQAARFLRLYDAVYLQDLAPTATVADRLACNGDLAALEARSARAKPIVRELLASQEASMEPGDMRSALSHMLANDTALEAVTLTLVEFIDSEVCKHYGIFASQVAREQQLNAWLSEALLDGRRSDGWDFLRWHANRPHAVHVVVDGLQGSLVRSLASGKAEDPFLEALLWQERKFAAAKPKAKSTRAAPAMSTGAITWAAKNGAVAKLPNLAKAVASPAFASSGISTTPTISVRNLPIAKTGAPVSGAKSTGIPNFHFVDRGFELDGVQQGRPWYFYGNDALQLTALTRASGMVTMFERLARLSTMSCGAQYDEAAGYSFDAFLSLAVGEAMRDFGDTRCVSELLRRAENEKKIAAIRDDLLAREPLLHVHHRPWELYDRWAQAQEEEAVRRQVAELAALMPESMPDYLQYYNPWPDHFAHPKGPFADEIVGPTGELARLDHWLGRISAAYQAAGVEPRTMYGMAGDHGLSTVYWIVSPEAEFVDGLAKDGVKLEVRKISSDEGEGPKLTHRLRPPSMRGLDLVVASTAGGNYMMDFFVDQEQNWGRQPLLPELQALRTLGGTIIDVPAELLERLGDSLDYLVVRGDNCTPEGGTVVAMGPRKGAISTATIERRGDRIWVGSDEGDLLGLNSPSAYGVLSTEAEFKTRALKDHCLAADRADPSAWCTEDEWRERTVGTARLDSVVQLAHLYDTDRAGTVNLFPRDGVGYNTNVPGRHAGESFHEKDAFVGLWGAPILETERALPAMVNGSVPMAMYGWLTGTNPQPGSDGWGWPAWPEGTWQGQPPAPKR